MGCPFKSKKYRLLKGSHVLRIPWLDVAMPYQPQWHDVYN